MDYLLRRGPKKRRKVGLNWQTYKLVAKHILSVLSKLFVGQIKGINSAIALLSNFNWVKSDADILLAKHIKADKRYLAEQIICSAEEMYSRCKILISKFSVWHSAKVSA